MSKASRAEVMLGLRNPWVLIACMVGDHRGSPLAVARAGEEVLEMLTMIVAVMVVVRHEVVEVDTGDDDHGEAMTAVVMTTTSTVIVEVDAGVALVVADVDARIRTTRTLAASSGRCR